jgi:peptide/nickel transport system substrate-binding protein
MDRSAAGRRPNFLRPASIVIAVGAIILAACTAEPAPSESAASAGDGSPDAAAPSASEMSGGSVPDNHFTLGIQSDPQSLDPAAATDLPGRSVMVNLYESLIRYEGSPPEPVPHLAESIEGSDDSQTFTVTLRPDVTFHDGSPLNAEAVAFSMDRVLTMDKGGASAFKALLSPGDTVAVDELTVEFSLSSPSAVFPSTLAYFFIVNPAVILANEIDGIYGEHGDYAEGFLQSSDAGSGPYQLVSRVPNSNMEFEAYADYWGGWEANQFGTYTVQLANEPASVGLLLREGEIDGIYENYPTNVFDDLEASEDITVYTDLGIKPFYLFMNNQKAPTDDPNVRRAIAYAFDYEQALAIAPGAVRLNGPLPDGIWGAKTTAEYDTNLDEARRLLEEAGVEPGEITLEFGALGGPASVQNKVALLVQDNLGELGINVEIANHAWADILQQTAEPDATKHLYAIQLAAEYPDPDALLFQGWHSSSGGSWFGAQWYSNPEVDALLEEGRTTPGQDARASIYEEIQETIVADSPSAFMMNLPIQVALHESIGGYEFVVSYYNYQVYDLFKQD